MDREREPKESPRPAGTAAAAGALAAALALGTGLCLRRSASFADAVPMVLLGLAAGFFTLKRGGQEGRSPLWRRVLPWLAALLGMLLLALNSFTPWRSQFLWLCGLLFLAWAVIFWNLAPAKAALCWLPLVLSLLVLPFYEPLMLMCSQPFRLVSAIMAEWLLRLCGYPILRDGSSLMVGDRAIVITYACSGLNQLCALSLIGYVIVQTVHRRTLCKILHFLLILPIIVYVNALRLVVTILLFNAIGEAALERFWHDTLGYVMVVLCALIFWYAQKLFTALDSKEKETGGK